MNAERVECGVTRERPQVFEFRSDDQPCGDRVDASNDFFGPYFDIECGNSGLEAFEFQSKGWLSDQAMFGRMKIADCAIRKTKVLDWDVIGLRIVLGGEIRGVAAERPFRARAGDVVLFDFSKPSTLEHHSANQIAVTVPKGEVGYVSGVHDPVLHLEAGSAQARFVVEYVRFVFRSFPAWSIAEAELATRALYGMLYSVLTPDRHDEHHSRYDRRARLQSIKQYIETNLAQPMLGIEMICRDFGLSRATLFRLFQGEGGLERYLQTRRLDQAYVDLASAPSEKGAIGKVAAHYSFCDNAHFSNSFVCRFGFRPSEIIGINRARVLSRARDPVKRPKGNSFEAAIKRLHSAA